MKPITKGRKKVPLLRRDPEHWKFARDQIKLATTEYADGGLRVDAGRLEENELTDLVILTGKASEGGGFSMSKLAAKEVAIWEGLVEKAAGRRPGAVFEERRKFDRSNAELRAIARDALRERRPLYEQEGAVVLPRGIWQLLESQVLWIDDVAVLALLLAVEARGGPIGHRSGISIEPDGTLVVEGKRGFAGDVDPDGILIGWKRCLDNMSRPDVGLLDVTWTGWTARIRRGPALIAMFDERTRESKLR